MPAAAAGRTVTAPGRPDTATSRRLPRLWPQRRTGNNQPLPRSDRHEPTRAMPEFGFAKSRYGAATMARRRSAGSGSLKVELDAPILALFGKVLPRVVAHRRDRLHREWAIRACERLLFAGIGLIGLHVLGWPPLITLISIALSLWTSVLVDLWVMLRLRRQGVTQFTAFQDLDGFVTEVAAVWQHLLTHRQQPVDHSLGRVHQSSIPDLQLGGTDSAIESPRRRLATGFGAVGGGIGMLLLIAFVPREAPMPPWLGAHPEAWLMLLVSLGLQIANEARALRPLPLDADPLLDWRLERGRLHGELRMLGLLIVHMLLVLTVVDARQAGEPLQLVLGAMFGAACLDLLVLQPLRRRTTRRLQALLEQPPTLAALA